MSEAKLLVKVLLDGRYALVIEEPDGAQQSLFYNANRTVYLQVSELRVSDNQCPVCGNGCLLDFGYGTIDLLPQASLRVRGRATLGEDSISLIGAPSSRAQALNIDFVALDEDAYDQHQQEHKRSTDRPYAHATVGFFHHQHGDAAGDDWFVVCQLAPDTLRGISSALSSGMLQAVTVGLELSEIYSDDRAQSPAQTSWFLRPNYHDSNPDHPHLVHGYVTCLNFDLASPGRHRAHEEHDVANGFEDTGQRKMSTWPNRGGLQRPLRGAER